MDDPVERFERLFQGVGPDLLAYALRRVDRPEDAADVVADTFLVAWRRIDDVPAGDAARLWLYGVARRTLANQRRGQLRRTQLADRLRDDLPDLVPDGSGEGDDALHTALAALSDQDRELLRLTSWEGLKPAEVATVMGLSRVSVRSRLHRARARLRAQLDLAAPSTTTRPSEARS